MDWYDHQQLEKKWQDAWEKARVFATPKKPKNPYYCLDMFPYPSAAGLHVGHPEGYTATDIVSRYKRMNGHDVLHPMGWDSFGLPAENYAIKTGIHPKDSTDASIKTFTKQIKSFGFSYDWDREINTADPEYMKWTQWFFLLLYKNKLAYKKEATVNWCESCQTVLANEQVVDGKCERCKNEVVQKNLEQWFFRVTAYADELLAELENLDYPSKLKALQRNWIGKSNGIEISYDIEGLDEQVTVFTTRPDTNFGATFVVVAPDSDFVQKHLAEFPEQKKVAAYIKKSAQKTELERISDGRKKTGVCTGLSATNQLNGRKMPVYVADFVLSSVGTGAVVGVPGHDRRDFEFARVMNLDIERVVVEPDGDDSSITKPEQVQEKAGTMTNSDFLDGMKIQDAIKAMKDYIVKKKWGKRVTTYKIRDWLVSRQRYWGAPIPIVHCEKCGEVPVPEDQLPVELPDDVDFKPTGRSPLLDSETFINTTCPTCGGKAKRETDTMDGFVDNSWYFLRYLSPNDDTQPFDPKETKTWMPVSLYVGGVEHAVGHLIYSRFFTKVLRDQGYLSFGEPYAKIVNQGIILAEDGRKMSKSLGNVINPDEVVAEYGADTVRMYEMFMGPFEDSKPWDTKGIVGVRRFTQKVYDVGALMVTGAKSSDDVTRSLHKTVKKLTEDIEAFRFNTAISQMMIFVNDVQRAGAVSTKDWTTFLKVLSPFAPHLAEELWEKLGNKPFVTQEKWPTYDAILVCEDEVEIVVQMNGKVRGKVRVARDLPEKDVLAAARAIPNVIKYLGKKKVIKEVVVPNRLVNFVL